MDKYLEFDFAADPIHASSLGVRDHDGELGDVSPDAVAEQCAIRRRFLAEVGAEPIPPVGTAQWLDHETALVELRTAVRRDEDLRVWARAPYWYAERLGAAISVLMSDPDRAEQLPSRLEQIPRYLRDAQANLTDETPALWAQMGVSGGKGLASFLSEAVPAYAATLPDTLGVQVSDAARAAVPAAQGFRAFAGELEQRAQGSWAGGREHFDFLLTEFHRLDLDADALHELGVAKVAEDRARLEELAARVDPSKPWPEQIARIKDRHPQPAEFLSTYGDEMVRSREHTLAHDLAWVPDGENCRMDWVPSYRAASLPIAVMSTTPPFAPGLQSEWLITPSDPSAPEVRRLEQMRDNCYVFAESIAGHEIYPGHHLQKVHHKLGTQDSPIRRFFSCPSFVEGWGLYVEDLFEETGFMDNDAVMLFKLRNALWRSLRIVIDTGLHTRGTSFEEAVSLLVEHAGMDTHMAAGEVRRYTRHDNPTYPSSYVLGKDAIHALREEWRERVGEGFTYRNFHDRLLSYGSIPVSLVATAMTGMAAS